MLHVIKNVFCTWKANSRLPSRRFFFPSIFHFIAHLIPTAVEVVLVFFEFGISILTKNCFDQPTNFSLHKSTSIQLAFWTLNQLNILFLKSIEVKTWILCIFHTLAATQWNIASAHRFLFCWLSVLFIWMGFISSNKLCGALSKMEVLKKGFFFLKKKNNKSTLSSQWTRIYLWSCD